MDDTTPERLLSANLQLQTPETPENHPRGFPLFLDSPANLLIPSSLFRPWDTPESLSPTSSNVPPESLSPSSSVPQTSPTSSTSSLPSSPVEPSSELSPSQTIFSSNGDCLYTLQPLEGQGVCANKQTDNDFIAGKDKSRKRKRKEKFQHSAASPILAKKSRTQSRGDFPPCGVCGEESTGVHYGAPVCEGCKGFFRRRVVYRDVSALVCGSGGQCDVTGKGRIHCKLCRYNRCVQIGMKPSSIKQEVKLPSNLSVEEQLLRCHKETMTPIPAVFLARQHTENMMLASEWPLSADLGPLTSSAPGASDTVRFVRSLPGWSELTQQDKQWSMTTGTVQVMIARLLARYRPEVGAYLFPCGQFVSPSQLTASLPEQTVGQMTSLAHNLASRGLTQQEMSLVCALLAVNPLNLSPLYKSVLTSVSECTSGVHLTDLALQVAELAWSAPPETWTNIVLANTESFNDFGSLM